MRWPYDDTVIENYSWCHSLMRDLVHFKWVFIQSRSVFFSVVVVVVSFIFFYIHSLTFFLFHILHCFTRQNVYTHSLVGMYIKWSAEILVHFFSWGTYQKRETNTSKLTSKHTYPQNIYKYQFNIFFSNSKLIDRKSSEKRRLTFNTE